MVALKFSFISGSRAETPEQQGAAEYLAAGAFVGHKRSSGVRSVRHLESLGAEISSRAGREHVLALNIIGKHAGWLFMCLCSIHDLLCFR